MEFETARCRVLGFCGSPPCLGIGTRQKEELIRKAAKQEGNGMRFSCFPALLISTWLKWCDSLEPHPPACASWWVGRGTPSPSERRLPTPNALFGILRFDGARRVSDPTYSPTREQGVFSPSAWPTGRVARGPGVGGKAALRLDARLHRLNWGTSVYSCKHRKKCRLIGERGASAP